MNTLIIQNPRSQGMLRRFTQSSLTLALWLLWFYLLLPALSPVLAWVGVDLPIINFREMNLKVFIVMLLSIAVIIVSFLLWIEYNILLYRHTDNGKKKSNIIHHHELARYFKVNPNNLANWHRSEQLTIQLTEQGNIHRIKV